MVFQRNRSWYGSWKEVPTGKTIRRRLSDHKGDAEKLEAEQRRKWDLYRGGLYHPSLDRGQTSTDEALRHHMEAMAAGRVGRKRGAPQDSWQEQVRFRLRRALNYFGAAQVRHLNGSQMDGFLDSLDTSSKTRDEYGRSIKMFGDWLRHEGYVTANPFGGFRPIHVKGRDETVTYRALTMDELKKLAAAAPDYACLYYVAATTGLRCNELKSLRWSDVHYEAPAHLHLKAYRDGQQQTKNGADAWIPLQGWIVDVLKTHRHSRPLGWQNVFTLNDHGNDAKMIRKHAALAGIPEYDDQGRRLVFHSLRASCTTILLDLGVPVDEVAAVMRHRDINTTLQHYKKNAVGSLAEKVDVIPDLRQA